MKEELKEGIATKIVDDIYVGGKNQEEAAILVEYLSHPSILAVKQN